jgi:hypothetical protein
MFARSGTTESDLFAEVVGFKGERHRPSYRFRDAFGCQTITYVQLNADRVRLRLHALEKRTG